jgi:hypothetical protein
MGAAEEVARYFCAVADDTAVAVLANGSDRLNSTLETVECMPLARRNQFERFVIVVSTNLTLCHDPSVNQACVCLKALDDGPLSWDFTNGEGTEKKPAGIGTYACSASASPKKALRTAGRSSFAI